MPINSRRKGVVAEQELANLLKNWGYDARRGQQFAGGGDSPDVMGLPGWHIEAKRVEAGNLYKWMKQAVRDAKPGNKPVVMHRRNKEVWVAIVSLTDFLDLVERANANDSQIREPRPDGGGDRGSDGGDAGTR